MEGFRVIPGFEDWCVTQRGLIYWKIDGSRVKTYKHGDRLFASYPDGKNRKLLAVHRAVALAWVENDNPSVNTIVNHLDGNPMNNWYKNLEWTTYSGNNYHAIATGLRSDCMPCKIRNFYTKEVIEFPSIAQASEFMRLPKDRVIDSLRPKKFGKLIAGQYEFRLLDDPEPFFYQDKDFIISPARFMVEVIESDGSKRYLFTLGSLLQQYQLYRSPYGRSVPALVKYANELYPDKKFTFRDAYTEIKHTGSKKRVAGITKKQPVTARRGEEVINFDTLTKAAEHFHVDRDVIKLRMSNPESTYLGWTFEGKPYFRET